MANVFAGASVPVGEKRESGTRTPALPTSPKPTGDPAPRNRPPHPQQTVEEYGMQSDRGERPTKGVYRQGVRVR